MTIRDLEVRLVRDIDDKLNEKFGYREYAVNIPGYGLVEPRPEVKAIDTTKISDAAKQVFSRGIGGRGIPNEIYTCKPPRSISESIIRGSQYWTIIRDENTLNLLNVGF